MATFLRHSALHVRRTVDGSRYRGNKENQNQYSYHYFFPVDLYYVENAFSSAVEDACKFRALNPNSNYKTTYLKYYELQIRIPVQSQNSLANS